MKKTFLSICGAALVCGFGFHAQANTILTDAGPGPISGDVNGTFGFDFTVGSTPLTITSLGLWDGPEFFAGIGFTGSVGDGFASAHVISLWDISGNLLATATMQIETADPLIGEFRYSSVLTPTNPGPVILAANTQYVLGASLLTNDGDSFKQGLGGNQPTYDPAVSPGKSRVSGFGFPTTSASPGAFVGPNATFNGNGVPEGGSTLLLMAMAIAIGWGVIALAIRQPRTLSGLKPSNR
jgi:hypothetical protein